MQAVCGRYTITTDIGRTIVDRFGADGEPPLETLHRFNVCPTETVAIVASEDGSRRVRAVRWGLVPPWARALGKGFEPINARSETAATKPPFAALMERADRRCLVVADGWYEWLRPEKKGEPRVPFRYTIDGGAPFAFAGLWDARRVAGERVDSATILTTRANAVCAPVHDRMPCVLAGPDAEAAWLSGELEPADLAELLEPIDPARCAAAPANPAVNKAGVEGPELLELPESEPADQLTLGL
jgi:putative SOS response-associated peptidase YedK